MRTTKYCLLLLIAISFFSLNCTHVNQLSHYKLTSGLFYFKYYVNPQMNPADVRISDYSYGNKFPFGVILESISESYMEKAVKEKLDRTIIPDSVTRIISDGIKEGLTTYYEVVPVESPDDDPDYIVETQLNGLSLSSNTYGIYLNVDTKIIITNREKNADAWISEICSSYPLRDIITGYSDNPWIRTTGGIINAVKLLQMTDDEIKNAVKITVQDVSKEQMERLKQDIQESTETKK